MKIALLGDSVLDNFYWLKKPKQDVRQQLSDLMPEATVFNYAVDESTVKDVLHGYQPFNQYVEKRRIVFKGDYPYPQDSNGKVYPLKLINKSPPTHVVLSIGGNDGRVHLSKLIWSAESLIEAIIEDDCLPQQLERLVKKILAKHKQLTLVFVYKPHVTIFEQFRNQVGWGMQYLPIEQVLPLGERLDQVYCKLREIFHQIARKYKLPLIDLSRTFDCKNRAHYGSTVIEPSNESGKTISTLIKYTIENHDFKGSAAVYYAPNCGETIRCESMMD